MHALPSANYTYQVTNITTSLQQSSNNGVTGGNRLLDPRILLLAAFTAGAGAATFTITNRCSFKVWPGAIPVGGGAELTPDEMWTLHVPAGTSAARIWPRTGCSFSHATGRGRCETSDCADTLHYVLSGNPPVTLAEFNLGFGGAPDNYDVSVVDGFNVPMDFACSAAPGGAILQWEPDPLQLLHSTTPSLTRGACCQRPRQGAVTAEAPRRLRCREPGCHDGNHDAGDGKYHSCQKDSDYRK